MVVAIADIESYPALKFLQVGFRIGTILEDEIHDVQVAMFCRGVISIRKPQ